MYFILLTSLIRRNPLVLVSVKSVGDLWEGDGALQSLHDIGLKVLGILNTARDADEVVVDTGDLTSLLWNTGVGHGGWNLNKRLYTSEGLGKSEDLGVLAEALSSGSSTLDAEREHTAAHAVAVLLLGNGVLWVGLQAWVVDSSDVWGGLKSVCKRSGVGGGLTGAEVEGLETTVSQPRVERGWDSTNGVLEETETLLHGVGVEGSNTHNNIGVAIDVLSDGVDDNVGTVVKWVLDVWGEEGVVDNNHDAVLVSLVGNSADIDQAKSWVGWGLDPDELGLWSDVLGEVDLDLWSEGNLDVVCLGDLSEVSVSSSVDVGNGNDVGSCGQRLEDHSGGGGSRGESKSIFGVLKSGHGLLKVVSVWVGGAGVLVLSDWLSNTGLSESGGEGDGLNHSTGDWVVRRSGVNSESAEAVDWRWRAWWGIDWAISLDLSDGRWRWVNGDSHVEECVWV